MFRLRPIDGDAAYEEMVKGMLKAVTAAVTVLGDTNSFKFWLRTLGFAIHDFLSKVQFLLNNNLLVRHVSTHLHVAEPLLAYADEAVTSPRPKFHSICPPCKSFPTDLHTLSFYILLGSNELKTV
jgi:hypothetical protein